MLDLRIAEKDELKPVLDFYYLLIDMMQGVEYTPAWQKGVYPSDEFLRGSLERRQLVIGLSEGKIVAAMVLNHESAEGYDQALWNTDAGSEEVTVVHALGILPSHQGRGFAGDMVTEAIRIAKTEGQKAIRLDVLSSNIPARRLYQKMGFIHVGTVKLFYEDTGLTDFLLYEYVLW